MPVIKANASKPDLHFVDPKNPNEILYLHRMYPWIAEEMIRSVIARYGPERKYIVNYLDGYHPNAKNN
ncbi:MAG: hypothetical protein QM791_04875 [Ferruginibacter sp.]